jgi:hypothetical protein
MQVFGSLQLNFQGRETLGNNLLNLLTISLNEQRVLLFSRYILLGLAEHSSSSFQDVTHDSKARSSTMTLNRSEMTTAPQYTTDIQAILVLVSTAVDRDHPSPLLPTSGGGCPPSAEAFHTLSWMVSRALASS